MTVSEIIRRDRIGWQAASRKLKELACPAVLQGDALTMLRTLPDESAQCCITSPPYWGLRDYGHAGQIGLEPTVDEFISKLVDVFREVRRVLKKDGTAWVNMGDSYASSGGAGIQGTRGQRADRRHTQETIDLGAKRYDLERGIKPKDLIGQPWMLAFALRADGWFLRQDIIWHKPNPMPESVEDRCTKAHEYIFLLSKSQRYYFDAEAIKEAGKIPAATKGAKGSAERSALPGVNSRPPEYKVYDGRRNKRSVWTVTTKPYADAHFATFPPDLIKPCILAGTKPGDVVLDPFGGSGTTGQVAIELGRRAVLIELNPEYLPLIERRCAVTPGFL